MYETTFFILAVLIVAYAIYLAKKDDDDNWPTGGT